NNLKGAEISFYFDNNSSKAIKRTTAPYCYTVANNECGDVNLKDIVSYGQHTLYVSAKTPLGQNLIKKINFTFKAPEPVEDPKPTPLPPKPQPPTNNDIQFTVNGVKDGSSV